MKRVALPSDRFDTASTSSDFEAGWKTSGRVP